MIGKDQLKKLMASDFWNYIAEINWGDEVKSASQIKQAGLKNIPPYKADLYKELCRDYVKELSDKVQLLDISRNYSRWCVFAACHEVVGFGKTEYERTLQNPHEIERILESIEFADNDNMFVNCLPAEDDYYHQFND
jgi:hypothetical protein